MYATKVYETKEVVRDRLEKLGKTAKAIERMTGEGEKLMALVEEYIVSREHRSKAFEMNEKLNELNAKLEKKKGQLGRKITKLEKVIERRGYYRMCKDEDKSDLLIHLDEAAQKHFQLTWQYMGTQNEQYGVALDAYWKQVLKDFVKRDDFRPFVDKDDLLSQYESKVLLLKDKLGGDHYPFPLPSPWVIEKMALLLSRAKNALCEVRCWPMAHSFSRLHFGPARLKIEPRGPWPFIFILGPQG